MASKVLTSLMDVFDAQVSALKEKIPYAVAFKTEESVASEIEALCHLAEIIRVLQESEASTTD